MAPGTASAVRLMGWGIQRKIQVIAAVAALGGLVSGCGTITQGTSQNITITSNPSGAHCDFNRKGEHVATLDKTPGSVKVNKTKNDILMTCTMAGFQDASVNLESGYGAGTFGNILLGGVIGWGIDSATGADNKYPSTANIQFVPVGATPPATPPGYCEQATAGQLGGKEKGGPKAALIRNMGQWIRA